MPIYEYQCAACGHTFDTIQSFKEEVLVDCPVCKEQTLKKLVSASAFHLKGSGWYVTDFSASAAIASANEESEFSFDNQQIQSLSYQNTKQILFKTKTDKAENNKEIGPNKEIETSKETHKDDKVKDTDATKPVAKTNKADTSEKKSS